MYILQKGSTKAGFDENTGDGSKTTDDPALVRRAVPYCLISLILIRALADLRGHVTDDGTRFLPSASCHWLVSCRVN